MGDFDAQIRDDDTADHSMIIQIDKIEAIKVQLEKFKRDLSNIPQQTAILSKTLQNMDHLETDVQKLASQLRHIRFKFQDESVTLKQKEKQMADKMDSLKAEIRQNLAQLDEMDQTRYKLEQKIKMLNDAASSKESEDSSLLVQNLRMEISELSTKMDYLKQEVMNLKREVERKDQLLYEKNRNIASLNEELENLMAKADQDTQKTITDRLSVALMEKGSDDEDDEHEDPNPAPIPEGELNPESLKKKYLIKLTDQLKAEILSLKESLHKADNFSNRLKEEVSELKNQLGTQNVNNRESGGYGLDASVLDMRTTDMLNMFRDIKMRADSVGDSPSLAQIQELRESISQFQQLGLSVIQEKDRMSKTESYNPYMDETSPPKELHGRPSDPFEDLAKVEESEKQAKEARMVDLEEVEKAKDELNKTWGAKLDEATRQLATLKNEMTSKDIMISKLKEKNLSIDTELVARVEERNHLIGKIDNLESELVKIKVSPPDTEKAEVVDNSDLLQSKKEVQILLNKLELLKAEVEFYKKHAQRIDPSILFGISDPAPEHQPHAGHSSAHHHEHSHYYPQDLQKSQRLSGSKQSEVKNSSEIQTKMSKLEAGLQQLATSTIESRPKAPKDERVVLLNRLNKEYAMLKASLEQLKKKLADNKEEQEKLENELKHADGIKSEEKVIVALEAKVAETNSKKNLLKEEYAISLKIEEQLKKDIAALVETIQKDDVSKIEANPALKSALNQSKLYVEEKPHTPLEELPQAKEPEEVKDKSHLQLPSEATSPLMEKTPSNFVENTIPLAKPIVVPPPPPVPKRFLEAAARLKDNKQVNEKLSTLL